MQQQQNSDGFRVVQFGQDIFVPLETLRENPMQFKVYHPLGVFLI